MTPANSIALASISDAARRSAMAWHAALAAKTGPVGAALSRIAQDMAVSVPTARRRYDLWRKGGKDWYALARPILAADAARRRRVRLHPDTIEHFRALCERNQRATRPAWREFIRQWRSGEPIPGISVPCPPSGGHGHPPGCSYANLMRHINARGYAITAARVGRAAAAACRPLVLTTRAGLDPGQYYIFDDLWHDFLVVRLGQARPMRLLQLHCLDLSSACQIARGYKPRVHDPLTGAAIQLREDEMLCHLAHVLSTCGYRPSGTVLCVEHGTAAISEDIERLLHELTGGAITVQRGGIGGAAAFPGLYDGPRRGNFRFKAALESLGNLIHNETANTLQLPGQTGANARIDCPEELDGRSAHAISLLRACAAIPPERARLLRMPFIELHAAIALCETIQDHINHRTDHALEGWSQRTAIEYRIPGGGLVGAAAIAAMPEAERAAIAPLLVPIVRRLSPAEIWASAAPRLVRLRPDQTAILLGTRLARDVTVRRGLIEFEDQDLAPEPLRYLAHRFIEGEKYRAVVNHFHLDTLHLFDARGRWLGTCEHYHGVPRHDTASLQRAMGRAAAIETEYRRPLAQRGAAITRQRIADARHNTRVLSGAPVTHAEHAAAAAVRRHGTAALDAILDPDPSPPDGRVTPHDPAEDDTFLAAISDPPLSP